MACALVINGLFFFICHRTIHWFGQSYVSSLPDPANQDLSTTHQELDEKKREIKRLKKELSRIELARSKKQDTLEDINKQIQNLGIYKTRKEMEASSQRKNSLASELAKSQSLNTRVSQPPHIDQLPTLYQRLYGGKREPTNAAIEYQNAQRNLRGVEAKLRKIISLKSKKSNTEKQIESVTRSVMNAKRRLESEKSSRKRVIRNKKRTITHFEKKIQETNAGLHRLSAGHKKDFLHALLKRHTASLHSAKNNLNSEKASKSRMIQNLKQTVTRYEKQSQTLNTELKATSKELDKLKKTRKELGEEAAKLTKAAQKWKEQLNAEAHQATQKRAKKLKNLLSDTKGAQNLSEAEKKILEAFRKVDPGTERSKELKKTLEILQTLVASWKQKINDRKLKTSRNKEAIEKESNRYDALLKKLSLCEERYRELEKKNTKAKKQHGEISTLLGQKNTAFTKLKAKFNQSQNELVLQQQEIAKATALAKKEKKRAWARVKITSATLPVVILFFVYRSRLVGKFSSGRISWETGKKLFWFSSAVHLGVSCRQFNHPIE